MIAEEYIALRINASVDSSYNGLEVGPGEQVVAVGVEGIFTLISVTRDGPARKGYVRTAHLH